MSITFAAFDTARSGMGAYKLWLDAVADNVSNIDNVTSTDQAAFKERFVLVTASEDANGQGTGVRVAGAAFGDPQDAAMHGDPDSAALGVEQAGKTGKAMLASFDFNQSGLDRIKAGTQGFAIDQQPYLQGNIATNLLANYIDFGNLLPTNPVLTGPGIVDSTNLEPTLQGVTAGAR